KAKSDLGKVRRIMSKAGKRRAAPRRSLPTERWLAMMSRPKGLGKAGVGAAEEKGAFPVYSYMMIRSSVDAVHRTGLAPLYWHHSSGADIPKAPGVSSKLRLLH
ncbi:MAG: hypothetical protein ACKPKO_24430, partial [Candidatus Fonsibacter sp.]